MASPLIWKVHSALGDIIASCRYPEHAVAIAARAGWGTKIKANGRIVWHEGQEDVDACDDARTATQTIKEREWVGRRDAYDKVHGAGAAQRVLDEKASAIAEEASR